MRERISIRLPAELKAELDRAIAAEGISRSDLLREALRDDLFARRFRALRAEMRLHDVLLAAFLARGACHDLLEHGQRHHRIVLSDFILGGFRARLAGKFRVRAPAIEAVVALLRGAAEMVDPLPLAPPLCRDGDDD